MKEDIDTPDHSAPDTAPDHPPRRRCRVALVAATLSAAAVAVEAVAVTGGTDDDTANPKSSGTHDAATNQVLTTGTGIAGPHNVQVSPDGTSIWVVSGHDAVAAMLDSAS